MRAKDRYAISSRAESTNSAGAVQLTPTKFGASNASRPAGTWESAGREKRVTFPPVDHALTTTTRLNLLLTLLLSSVTNLRDRACRFGGIRASGCRTRRPDVTRRLARLADAPQKTQRERVFVVDDGHTMRCQYCGRGLDPHSSKTATLATTGLAAQTTLSFCCIPHLQVWYRKRNRQRAETNVDEAQTAARPRRRQRPPRE